MPSITCPANSRLTDQDMTILSSVFPRPAQTQFIELRRILSDYRSTFRTYKEGQVTFDMEGLTQRVLAKCPAKTLDRLNQLLDQGLCLQAIATTHLRIPLVGQEGISLTT